MTARWNTFVTAVVMTRDTSRGNKRYHSRVCCWLFFVVSLFTLAKQDKDMFLSSSPSRLFFLALFSGSPTFSLFVVQTCLFVRHKSTFTAEKKSDFSDLLSASCFFDEIVISYRGRKTMSFFGTSPRASA